MTNGFLSGLGISKRKIFVSYHHGGDRAYYDAFVRTFSESYDIIHDNSLDRAVNSNDTDYVIRRIKENCIKGSSCTIVLCGVETPFRKFVDWEIKATLDRQHGLIGVNLPSNPMRADYKYIVPDRLCDNVETGYAVWVDWASFTQSAQSVQQYIELANSKNHILIDNNRSLRRRNG